MSKRTVYSQFESRHALFSAYFARLRDSATRPLDESEKALPLEERLRRLLTPRGHNLSEETMLALFRATVTESLNQPDRGRNFWRDWIDDAALSIRLELDRAVGRGEIRITNTDAAARLLMDMAYGNAIDPLLIADRPCSLFERQTRLELALEVFLRGIDST